MKRVILIVLGVILLFISVPILIAGVVFTAIGSGDDPTVQGRLGQVGSSGYAVVSDTLDVDWDYPFADRFDITVGVQSTGADSTVFIGYGPASAVDAYLSGVPQTVVYGLGDGRSEREVEVPGSATPEPPGEQDFWIERASGTGRQEIPLAAQTGSFRLVVMNADGSQGVMVDVYGSMTLPFLVPMGIGMLAFGLLLLILAIVLLVWGIRSKPAPAPAPGPSQMHPQQPPSPYPPAGAGYPAGYPYPPGSDPYGPPGQYPGVAPGGPVAQTPPPPASSAPGPEGPATERPTPWADPSPKQGEGDVPPR